MDLNKFLNQLEDLADKALNALDKPDSNSVWSNATRINGSEVGTISRHDLEFLCEAAEEHPAPAVRRYVKTLKEKYLGTDPKA